MILGIWVLVFLWYVVRVEFYIFFDVLELVIVVVLYVRVVLKDGLGYMGFVMGKVKEVIKYGMIIFRLELFE